MTFPWWCAFPVVALIGYLWERGNRWKTEAKVERQERKYRDAWVETKNREIDLWHARFHRAFTTAKVMKLQARAARAANEHKTTPAPKEKP